MTRKHPSTLRHFATYEVAREYRRERQRCFPGVTFGVIYHPQRRHFRYSVFVLVVKES